MFSRYHGYLSMSPDPGEIPGLLRINLYLQVVAKERESHRTLHTASQAIQSPKIWKEKMASLIMLPTSNTRLNAQNTKARLFSITRTIPMPMPKMQFPLPKQNKTKLKYQTTL
jgi:hypothetical protein